MDSCVPSGVVPPGAASFVTTRWSVVIAAGDLDSSEAACALERLCRAYWFPIYSYLRRKGVAAHDAQDVTQEFFRRLIEKNYLASVDRRAGSFRCFLLASVNHLLANEWDKARAIKRGGGREIISLDAERAEGRFNQEAAVNGSAEKAFDRGWALTLLDRALSRLRDEFIRSGKGEQFEALKAFLSDTAGEGDYESLAEQIRMSPGRIAVAVHRLRQRYRELVRSEIAETVSTEEELQSEMRHLFESLD